MAKYGRFGVGVEVFAYNLMQLAINVRVHSKVCLPLLFGGINVEAGTDAKIPPLRFAFDVAASLLIYSIVK